MNTQAENAIKWLEALLSGNYRQTKEGILGDEVHGFCCWGVGCYVTNTPYAPDDKWESTFAKVVGFNNEDGFLKKLLYGHFDLAGINDETNAGFIRIGKFLIKTADLHFVPEVATAIKEHFNKT